MATTVRVELGARSYDVRIGGILAPTRAAAIAAALDPATTGVAVLVDAGLDACSPRVAPLCEALARAAAARRAARAAGRRGVQEPRGDRAHERVAREPRLRSARAPSSASAAGRRPTTPGSRPPIYLRGVPFALVPTTLLAMVDASVGGKTGVDLRAGKNLVGAFHQPRAVIADVGFLDTLPARERTPGLAEVVKCGFIADAGLLDLLEQRRRRADRRAELTLELIARAVRVKAEVVASDEREGGRRAILNFGHTVGHALEAASGYGLLHGEAVALGMVAALRLGAALGVGSAALVERARAPARAARPADRLRAPLRRRGRWPGSPSTRSAVGAPSGSCSARRPARPSSRM